MGRPPTKPIKLKDGYYIEVRNKGAKSGGIKIRRETKAQLEQTIKDYQRTKDVIVLGKSKNGKWVDKK
jgi:hypothetical protein